MAQKSKSILFVGVILVIALYIYTKRPKDDEVLPTPAADGLRPEPRDVTAGVKIGDAIGSLTFKDIRFLPRSLDDFKDKKAFVLVFTNTTCPLVQRYLVGLQRMDKEYRDKGVQFLAVNVSDEDTILEMATQAVEHEMEFPFVKDTDGKCVAALGVKRTPEAVILDAERKLRYRGRIDDQYRLGGGRDSASRADLLEALNDVLAGRSVAIPETPVDGCLISTSQLKAIRENLTFTEHVAPIVQKHCQECHRPGTPTPFSLITYEQVKAKAKTIAEVVADRRMPPWFASPKHDTFSNRRGLSAAERETLIVWAQGDLAVGDRAKLPEMPKAATGSPWLIGEPDVTSSTPEYDIPTEGEIPYKYATLALTFPEDTYVEGVQILPSNPRIVHHANLIVMPTGGNYRQGRLVTGTVPGGEPMRLDQGTAYRIPKDSALILQIHLVPTGQPAKCNVTVGLRYARGVVQKQLRYLLMADSKFAIPPGAPAHRTQAIRTLDRDADGLAMFAHMHYRGRDMTFRAHKPDGTVETLLMVPNYNFDWQLPYRWELGTRKFPKGTKIETIAHFDNSRFNAFNPDPNATVKDGLQTKDEMSHGYFFYFDEAEQLGLEIDPTTGRVKK